MKKPMLNQEIQAYNDVQTKDDRAICDLLRDEITRGLPAAEGKVWHAHPVWFLNGNPIVGYHKLKSHVRVLFWSGQSFDEAGLASEGKFKAAGAHYTALEQVDKKDLKRWLEVAGFDVLCNGGTHSTLEGSDGRSIRSSTPLRLTRFW